MKYNIIKLQQHSTGSVHCTAVKDQGKVATYLSRVDAKHKASKLKSEAPNSTFIVSKHWR